MKNKLFIPCVSNEDIRKRHLETVREKIKKQLDDMSISEIELLEKIVNNIKHIEKVVELFGSV